MYEECARECARWNINPGGRTVALAVLQSDDHCGAIFGTDEKGTDAFNVWVQHRKYQPVVGQFAAAKLKQQTREPITEKRRKEAWYYWHEKAPLLGRGKRHFCVFIVDVREPPAGTLW